MGKATKGTSRHEPTASVTDPDTGLVVEQPVLKPEGVESEGLYARPGADNARMRMQVGFLGVLAAERPDTVRALAEILGALQGWPLSGPTVQAIRDWAARYSLEADDSSDWVFVAANHTLRHWRGQEIDTRSLEWPPRFHPPIGWIDAAVRPNPFTFAFGGWQGDRQPWIGWAAAATAEYHQALLAYHDKVARELVAQGCTLTPDYGNRVHWCWLVRYQVGGETYAGISRGPVYAEESTVREGVKKAASRIGLRLRLTSRGSNAKEAPAVTPF
jgi:hypothetical protein